ncbi:mersacidin family lantibiotic [Enterococcus sp. RIT-PI-f]|uniref:mersacidin family lantibiotic n=1 Tax=Enterococcus sp. RIT-PI-f TaxID=1690244 RepID=UPI000AF2713F|nr:type 2 lantibiotic [Enterococcus sp. RIT-PI-f]
MSDKELQEVEEYEESFERLDISEMEQVQGAGDLNGELISVNTLPIKLSTSIINLFKK